MEYKKSQKELSKNIFKDNANVDIHKFSAKWIELINRSEKAKAINA